MLTQHFELTGGWISWKPNNSEQCLLLVNLCLGQSQALAAPHGQRLLLPGATWSATHAKSTPWGVLITTGLPACYLSLLSGRWSLARYTDGGMNKCLKKSREERRRWPNPDAMRAKRPHFQRTVFFSFLFHFLGSLLHSAQESLLIGLRHSMPGIEPRPAAGKTKGRNHQWQETWLSK